MRRTAIWTTIGLAAPTLAAADPGETGKEDMVT